jgi:hypothetical protein
MVGGVGEVGWAEGRDVGAAEVVVAEEELGV